MLYKQDDRITKMLAEAAENDPRIKEIFDSRVCPEVCKFAISEEDPLIGSLQSVQSDNFPRITAKIKLPNFLTENQKLFYMNRFSLKCNNE